MPDYTYLWVDVYHAGVHVFHDRDACARWLSDAGERAATDRLRYVAGLCHTFEDARGIDYHALFIPKGATPGTVAHECAHLAFDICNGVGIAVREHEVNEPYCYLLDLLVDRVTPLVKPRARRGPTSSQPS